MFSLVHLHLAINHAPLYTESFAFVLLLIGTLRRNRTLITTALVIAVAAALSALATDFTGNGAADFLKSAKPPIAGVDLHAIREHDQAAGYVVWTASITGVLALVAWWRGRRSEHPRWMLYLVLFAIAFTLSVVLRTSLLGGRIHHEETRVAVQS